MTPIADWPAEFITIDAQVAEEGEGSAWIQWKGTSVCMDVNCKCGADGHVDADFAYFYSCPGCGRLFIVSQVVRLHPVTPELEAKLREGGTCIVSPAVDGL